MPLYNLGIPSENFNEILRLASVSVREIDNMTSIAVGYRSLPDIDDIEPLSEADKTCLQEVREVLKKHNQQAAHMLTYCKLDTLALVRLQKYLEAMQPS